MSAADVLVVGAGPAGATAAILLARAGARVVIVDRARFPREKLCGEFVSPEAVGTLARTGVLAQLAPSAGRAREVLLTVPARHCLRLPITSPAHARGPALGIPRKEMDDALLRTAARAGARIVEGFEVRRLLFSTGRVAGVAGLERGSAREASFEADLVLAADGRGSAVRRLLTPQSRRARVSALFGLKAHYRSPVGALGGAVELHYVRGGYVGLHAVGEGLVNVCALLDRSLAGALPTDPEQILRQVFFRNPAARERLEAAERVSDWLAVGALVFQTEAPVRAGALFLGDAAGTIDPFAGEGMSMAFRSAEIAVEEIVSALGGAACASALGGAPGENGAAYASALGGAPGGGAGTGAVASALGGALGEDGGAGAGPDALGGRYARRWRKEFAGRIALCRVLGRLAIRPSLQGPMLALLRRFPAAGRALVQATRSRAEIRPQDAARA